MFQNKPEHITGNDEKETLTESQIVARIENLDRIVDEKDVLLAEMHPFIIELMEARHHEEDLPHTVLDNTQPITDQLYDEPTYNDRFIHGVDTDGKGGDLDARRGEEFRFAENYEEGQYTKVILKAAQALGFVAPEVPVEPTDALDAQLGIADSYLKPIDEPVEAVIIPTARSISNPMRVRDALRNIENGKIKTNKVIIASCDREVDDAERAKMDPLGLHYGATEFESGIASFNDFAGTDIDPSDAKPLYIEIGGIVREGKQLVRTVELPSGPVELIAVSVPFDEDRQVGRNADGSPKFATRANTQENMLAAYEFLSEKPGLIAMESHDVWAQSQAEAADQILGSKGKRTVPTGPFKLDRLTLNKHGKLELNKPGEVVDEIAKVYAFATKTRIAALNARKDLMNELENIQKKDL